MRTVGQTLKEEREKKFYTLEEIEKVTKIRKELLVALEADNFTKLPPPTFVQGFIRNYSRFLGLDSEKLLAIYRREFADYKHPPKIMDSLVKPIGNKRFHLTPSKAIGGAVLILVLSFFAYLWIEYRFLAGAPFLDVSQPKDQISVSSDLVQVIGKTNPEAKITINNQEVQVDLSGNFSQEIKLPESVNTIKVAATSKLGQTATIERTVFLKK